MLTLHSETLHSRTPHAIRMIGKVVFGHLADSKPDGGEEKNWLEEISNIVGLKIVMEKL